MEQKKRCGDREGCEGSGVEGQDGVRWCDLKEGVQRREVWRRLERRKEVKVRKRSKER